MTNKHPVDELAAVRASMRGLKGREAQLRQMIIDSECSWDGAEYEADVRESAHFYIAADRLIADHPAAEFSLARYLTKSTSLTVTTKRKA